MMRFSPAIWFTVAMFSLALGACDDDDDNNEDELGAPDTDSDGDSDADSDVSSDTDSDGDLDTDSDGDSDSDVDVIEARSKLSYDTTPDIGDADFETYIANTNDFGFLVFEEFRGEDENLVFSPVSISVALGMTYAGSRNNTAAEMAAAMQNDLPNDKFHAAGNRLQLMLEERNIAPYKPQNGDGEKSL